MEDAEKTMELVGRRISELRTKAGLTQAEVAEKLGSTISNYQRIEHGLQNLTIRMLVKVAGAIGVATASLFETPQSKKARRGRPKGSRRRS